MLKLLGDLISCTRLKASPITIFMRSSDPLPYRRYTTIIATRWFAPNCCKYWKKSFRRPFEKIDIPSGCKAQVYRATLLCNWISYIKSAIKIRPIGWCYSRWSELKILDRSPTVMDERSFCSRLSQTLRARECKSYNWYKCGSIILPAESPVTLHFRRDSKNPSIMHGDICSLWPALFALSINQKSLKVFFF